MKVSQIKSILNATWKANQMGHRKFVPLFTGEAGIGKSEICQEWVKDMRVSDPDFQFLDLRIAYMDSPDFVGLVFNVVSNDGTNRTCYSLPEFWPTEGRGLILLEEPNRGQQSVMNALMQLLTDRKVMNYSVPNGFIIAGAINPEIEGYDVNHMDVPLRNRFTEFETVFDKQDFLTYVKANLWFEPLVAWLDEGWSYFKSGEVGTEGSYITPRSLSKLNTIEVVNREVGVDPNVRINVIHSVLGKGFANQYIQFVDNDKPLLAGDFIKNKEKALERLKKMTADKVGYRGDLVNPLIDSVIDSIGKGELVPEIVFDLAPHLNRDMLSNLFIDLSDTSTEKFNPNEFMKKYENEVKAIAKSSKRKTKPA